MEASIAFKPPASRRKQGEARRVVITGMGVVSPLGTGLEKFWTSLINGESGIGRITLFDASSFPCQIAAEVRDFEPKKYLTPRQIRFYSRGSQFACAAFAMAKEDAKIESFDPFRTDVIFGSAISAFGLIEEEIIKRPDSIAEYKGVADPTAMFKAIITAPSTAIALMAQTQGYVTTVSSACTSGLNSLGLGYQRIKANQADTVICGGGDTPINRLILTSFCAANFLATNNDHETAMCPFDERHTKSVLCEGAGMFILEEFEQAKARGAKIYAEVTAFNQGTENINELFLMDKSGDRWAELMDKSVAGKKIDYVNANAPSDLFIDRIEAKSLVKVLGKRKMKTLVSSIKGAVGGHFASAGAFQVAATAMSLTTGIIPPVFNYQIPDPECNLNIQKGSRVVKNLGRALINAHGSGSFNSSMLLEKVHQ